MGLCRLARTVCERVGERWRDGAGSLPSLGIRSHRCLHTCWRGRSMGQIFDHRETVTGLCRLARTVCESLGERWRDGAGSLPILGYPVTPVLAHMLARAVDGTDFRPSRNGDGAVPAGAHSLREFGRAMARQRRLLFDLNAVASTRSTNTLSMRSPNANLIYSPSRVSEVSCEDGPVFVEGQLTTPAYACRERAASYAPHSPDRACPPRVMCNKSVGIEDRGMG
jgi:hypothetical protein